MMYSLTDRLNFDANPQLQIKDMVLTVKADAMTVLEVMDIVSNEGEMAAVGKACDLLFSPEDKQKIDSLNLNMVDFTTLITTAVTLATGGDPDKEEEGNA